MNQRGGKCEKGGVCPSAHVILVMELSVCTRLLVRDTTRLADQRARAARDRPTTPTPRESDPAPERQRLTSRGCSSPSRTTPIRRRQRETPRVCRHAPRHRATIDLHGRPLEALL